MGVLVFVLPPGRVVEWERLGLVWLVCRHAWWQLSLGCFGGYAVCRACREVLRA